MKKTTLYFFALLLVLSACRADTDNPLDNEISYPNPSLSYPNPSYPNPSEPAAQDVSPKLSDAGLLRGEVHLDSADLLTMESFPLQFMLALNGSLPTPCHQLRAAISPPDSKNRINVEIYSVVKPDEICIQVLQEFDVNIPLGSFPAGMYSVWVNGEMVAEFQG